MIVPGEPHEPHRGGSLPPGWAGHTLCLLTSRWSERPQEEMLLGQNVHKTKCQLGNMSIGRNNYI
jgi:hypothetical protein